MAYSAKEPLIQVQVDVHYARKDSTQHDKALAVGTSCAGRRCVISVSTRGLMIVAVLFESQCVTSGITGLSFMGDSSIDKMMKQNPFLELIDQS